MFSSFFKLVGECNGCNGDFFDRLPSRGQRDLYESVSTRVISRVLTGEDSGTCSCDKDARVGGVSFDEFAQAVNESFKDR
jgi:hypothetical protein